MVRAKSRKTARSCAEFSWLASARPAEQLVRNPRNHMPRLVVGVALYLAARDDGKNQEATVKFIRYTEGDGAKARGSTTCPH